MIYEEIIVIHLCGLDHNIKEEINNRGIMELEESRSSINSLFLRSSVK